ncbi:MAG TPA: DUF4405 domain-containing protein [Gemmatimonadaceae bacterium]
MTSSRWRIRRHAWIAILDSILLVAFLALSQPGDSTGYQVHEWIGVSFIVLFILHVWASWSWITMTWRRARSGTGPRARLNFLLNSALCVMMVVVITSGLVISQYVLPAVGIRTDDSQRWEQLHNFTSSLLLGVIGLHVALNWSWIKGAIRRYCVAPVQRLTNRAGAGS